MKAFSLSASLLALVAGCASHGTWSKSDHGSWANLDEVIGSHEQIYYVKEWGEPVSRHEVKFSDDNGNISTDGEELLWLWKPDGTGLSEHSNQRWEIYLSFDREQFFRNWRIGEYWSTLTVPDVITATRKVEASFEDGLCHRLDPADFTDR
jgi:hypothetical protein